MRKLAQILAFAAALWVSNADAQNSLFPPTLQPNTVVGRLGIGAGPGQAIPFGILSANLFLALPAHGVVVAEGSGTPPVGITPGTAGLPFVSNGASADPSYQLLLSAGNPFNIGASLYPVITGTGHYNTTSALLANTLGAKNAVIGLPATDVVTWVNSDIAGVDQACNTTVGCVGLNVVSPNGFHALVTASRSSDQASGTPQNIISHICDSRHDNTTVAHNLWCQYLLGVYTSGSAASNHLLSEISLVYQATAVTNKDPFTINPTGNAANQRLDCGNGVLTGNDCPNALDIVPNGQKYVSGIIFGNGALDTVLNAQPDAIAFPPNYSISIFNAAGARTWKSYGDAGANGNWNFVTAGTGAVAVTALNETTGQAYTAYVPTLTCSAGTLTTASATGRYRQLGKTVHYQINASITTVGTCTTNLLATLPFTAANFPYTAAGRENALTGAMVQGFISASGTTVSMTGFDNSTGTTTSGGTGHATMLANGANFIISGTYEKN